MRFARDIKPFCYLKDESLVRVRVVDDKDISELLKILFDPLRRDVFDVTGIININSLKVVVDFLDGSTYISLTFTGKHRTLYFEFLATRIVPLLR